MSSKAYKIQFLYNEPRQVTKTAHLRSRRTSEFSFHRRERAGTLAVADRRIKEKAKKMGRTELHEI